MKIEGTFAIKNTKTSLCLRPYNAGTHNGNTIITYRHHHWKCITWTINQINNNSYKITNFYTKKSFSPSKILSGSQLYQNSTSTLIWDFIPIIKNEYKIKLHNTNLYITAPGITKINQPIILSKITNQDTQIWKLIKQHPLF